MATLATYYRGRDALSRCDAGCYDGDDERCVCLICGGRNHGVGYERAVAQTRQIVAEWYAVGELDGGRRRDRIVLGLACVQLALF